MIRKLVFLCSKVIAQDCTERRRYQLQYVVQLALPTSVLSYLFSSLPVNRLIQLEEDYPDRFSWEECWQALCDEHATNHKLLDRRLSSNSRGSKWSYKEIFLNTYFKELCSGVLDRNLRSYAGFQANTQIIFLQDSVGCSKHDILDEEMLLILLKHITELTITQSNIFLVQDLMKLSCSEKLKYLQLEDKCSHRWPAASSDNWLFCLKHVLQNSQLRGLHTSNCTQILTHMAQIKSSGHGVKSNPFVRGDVAISGGCLASTKDDAVSSPPGPISSITELTLHYCITHASWPYSRESLQRMYSLEKLSVFYYVEEQCNLHLLNSIRELLESGLSHLKIICFDMLCDIRCPHFWTFPPFPEPCSVGSENISEENILKCCSTGVNYLVLAGICSDVGGELFERVLPNFLRACNPSYLYIYFDERQYKSFLPFFSPPDLPLAKKHMSNRLQKITVVHKLQKVVEVHWPSMNYSYLIRAISLAAILRKLACILEDTILDIDLSLHCVEEQLPNFMPSFKSVEVTVLEKPSSVWESLPEDDSEESSSEFDSEDGD